MRVKINNFNFKNFNFSTISISISILRNSIKTRLQISVVYFRYPIQNTNPLMSTQLPHEHHPTHTNTTANRSVLIFPNWTDPILYISTSIWVLRSSMFMLFLLRPPINPGYRDVAMHAQYM